MNHHRTAAAAFLSLLLAALLPAAVAAHSELVVSDPADGAILTGPPLEVAGDYSEELDAARSVMELRAPGGSVLAIGGVPGDGPSTRMAIVGLPALDPGTYEVRWTTVTADDNGVERGTFTFTLLAATPTPAPAAASPSATVAPTSEPSPAPSPAPALTPEAGSTGGDLLVPLAVLAGILVGGAAWLLRRRR